MSCTVRLKCFLAVVVRRIYRYLFSDSLPFCCYDNLQSPGKAFARFWSTDVEICALLIMSISKGCNRRSGSSHRRLVGLKSRLCSGHSSSFTPTMFSWTLNLPTLWQQFGGKPTCDCNCQASRSSPAIRCFYHVTCSGSLYRNTCNPGVNLLDVSVLLLWAVGDCGPY